MEGKEKPIEKIDLTKTKSLVLKELIDSKLITEQGLKVSGQGIIIEALNKIKEECSKTNKQLYFIEKNLLERLDKLIEKIK